MELSYIIGEALGTLGFFCLPIGLLFIGYGFGF